MTRHESRKDVVESSFKPKRRGIGDYEGECAFLCSACGHTFAFYAFDEAQMVDFRTYLEEYGHYRRCEACGYDQLTLVAYHGPPFSFDLLSLARTRQYLAAVVVLAAFVEFQLDNLLHATLLDDGTPRTVADRLARGTLDRGEAVRLVRASLGRKVKNVIVPVRNEIAHGRGFVKRSADYEKEFASALDGVEEWVASVGRAPSPSGEAACSEVQRWRNSMSAWLDWFRMRWRQGAAGSDIS